MIKFQNKSFRHLVNKRGESGDSGLCQAGIDDKIRHSNEYRSDIIIVALDPNLNNLQAFYIYLAPFFPVMKTFHTRWWVEIAILRK
jgi:hypothetical protein